jgi:hypothetical protein
VKDTGGKASWLRAQPFAGIIRQQKIHRHEQDKPGIAFDR